MKIIWKKVSFSLRSSRDLYLAVVAMGIVSLSPFLLAQATLPPQPTTVAGATSHVYKTVGQHELLLHVVSPGNSITTAARPVIVFFFGGGWVGGNINQFLPHANHLAERGMVAVLADYRVRNRHGSVALDSMADANSAIRWIRAHATELNVDPQQLIAAGGSAGGHLAAASALITQFDSAEDNLRISAVPNALALFNPAVDIDAFGERVAPLFSNQTLAASPVDHLDRGLPPTVIVHGRADTTVPHAHVVDFCARAQANGDSCQLHSYDGAEHGFFNRRPSGDPFWFTDTLLNVDRFLTELGYLPEPAATNILGLN